MDFTKITNHSITLNSFGWYELFIDYADEIAQDFLFDVKENGDHDYYVGRNSQGILVAYVHNHNAEWGFGGVTIACPMNDGEIRSIKGPWSGRAAVYQWAGFEPMIDVVINHQCFYLDEMTVNDLLAHLNSNFYAAQSVRSGEAQLLIKEKVGE